MGRYVNDGGDCRGAAGALPSHDVASLAARGPSRLAGRGGFLAQVRSAKCGGSTEITGRTSCRFRFAMANALLLELHVGGVSGHGGERVFPLFVANPRTVRLYRFATRSSGPVKLGSCLRIAATRPAAEVADQGETRIPFHANGSRGRAGPAYRRQDGGGGSRPARRRRRAYRPC